MPVTQSQISKLAAEVLAEARALGLKLATAESCTGGLIGAALTDIAGSSSVFERGFITYSNDAKHELLGVPAGLLRTSGAVSAEVASAMALGALKHSKADIAVSITGVAGPGGGSPSKPVGLVHFAVADSNGSVNREERRFGDLGRANVRAQSVLVALTLLQEMISRRNSQFA